MDHGEFVEVCKAGRLRIDVDRTKALQVAASSILPKSYQLAHLFWTWVSMLTVPAALAVMYFHAWWSGLLVLVFVTPALFRATRTSALQFMIDHAVDDPKFYAYAIEQGVITLHPKA